MKHSVPSAHSVSKASSTRPRLKGVSDAAKLAPRPFLKWAGGKSQLLTQLRPFFPPEYGAYFEPFLGGGALYFFLQPANAFLNDINPALKAAYENIRSQPEAVIESLRELQAQYLAEPEPGRERLFYRIRADYNALQTHGPQKSAYLIFLNKTGFNGMYRENSKGRFNVPFGQYKNPGILDEHNLRRVSELLQTASLTSCSFDKAVSKAKPGDFVYFDPPYDPLSSTSSFTSYHSQDFSKKDQIKLRECFVELHKLGCFVMLSNSYTDFVRELYRDFPQHTVLANRAINCKAEGRGKIKELLVTSYKT